MGWKINGLNACNCSLELVLQNSEPSVSGPAPSHTRLPAAPPEPSLV